MVSVSKLPQFGESTFSMKMNPKGGVGANVQVRNQATITEPLHHIEMGTSTRKETAEAGVSTIISHLTILFALDQNCQCWN